MHEIKKLYMIGFKSWHLKSLKLRPEDGELDLDRLGKKYEIVGPAYTCIDRKKILFCAGIIILWRGVGESWSLCDVEVKNYPREVLFYQKECLFKEIEANKLHRIQAHCLTTWRSGYRFLERLGFEREGLVRKYDSEGRDYYLYSLIKE